MKHFLSIPPSDWFAIGKDVFTVAVLFAGFASPIILWSAT